MPTPLKVVFVIAIFVVGGVCGVLVCLLHDEGPSGSAAPDKGRAFSPVEGREAAELAESFRPWLMFDSDEAWRPVSISSLLAERNAANRPTHLFCTRLQKGTSCQPIGDLDQLKGFIAESSALGRSTYIDIAGDRIGEYQTPQRSPSCRREKLSDCDDAPGSAIYYRVTYSNQRYYIDYWWFLRFNHFWLTNCSASSEACDEHEGDWEGVTLVTPPEDTSRLDYVVYATHKGTFRYPAEPLRHKNSWRPEVFVANGSHAAYPLPCKHRICRQPISFKGLDLPESRTDGKAPWARNGNRCGPDDPGNCLRPLPIAEPGQSVWTTWSGLWGASCGKRCGNKRPQSPDSPGLQPRFLAPWCSTQEGLLICDTSVLGCSDWLGPLVAAVACNPTAVARGLQSSEELPSGGLILTVATRNGLKRKVSATTKGIVQALGAPLRPGSHMVVRDAGAGTEILIRAQKGKRILEARFSPFSGALSGQAFEVEVRALGNGAPVLHATLGDGSKVGPQERRRITLSPRS